MKSVGHLYFALNVLHFRKIEKVKMFGCFNLIEDIFMSPLLVPNFPKTVFPPAKEIGEMYFVSPMCVYI